MLKQNLADAGVPDITGVWCHEIGASRLLHGVSIKQRYPGHSKQAGHIAAQCQAANYANRFIIVVDDDIDVSKESAVVLMDELFFDLAFVSFLRRSICMPWAFRPHAL